MNLPSARLAAWTRIHAVNLSLRADAAANAVDHAAAKTWAALLSHLRARPGMSGHGHTVQLLRSLLVTVQTTARERLLQTAQWAGRDVQRGYTRGIPLSWLRAMTLKRLQLLESRELHEDAERRRPGVIEVALRAAGLEFRKVDFRDLARRLREPATSEMHAEEQREAFGRLLFPPPDLEDVTRLFHTPISGFSWADRLAASTSLADPARLGQTITQGFSQGKLPSEIARDILPAVDGVRSSARRIARTASMQLAHQVQRQADNGLIEAEMLTGWQTHATLDENTRPWHAHRNGRIYYLHPKGRQPGLDKMPNPPSEPEDVNERPPGTPQTAWNCRCRNSPVLTAPDYLLTPEAQAVFKNNAGKLIPDAVSYSEWFDAADPMCRKRAVGVRRYAEVESEWGGAPPWEAFIDPATGDLMPLASLRRESGEERAERAGEVRRIVADRAAALRQVGLMGFELA